MAPAAEESSSSKHDVTVGSQVEERSVSNDVATGLQPKKMLKLNKKKKE